MENTFLNNMDDAVFFFLFSLYIHSLILFLNRAFSINSILTLFLWTVLKNFIHINKLGIERVLLQCHLFLWTLSEFYSKIVDCNHQELFSVL